MNKGITPRVGDWTFMSESPYFIQISIQQYNIILTEIFHISFDYI